MWPLFNPSESGFVSIVLTTINIIFVFVLSVKIVNYFFGGFHISLRGTKRHSWRRLNISSKPLCCSICETLFFSGQGVYCDSCGVCADTECMKKAEKKFLCKAMTMNTSGPMKHHWVKGNLTLGAVCEVCEEDCGSGPGLADFQCCWCQYAVHTKCIEKLTEICDFGRYRLMTIPPGCVEVANRFRNDRKNLQVRSVSPPPWPKWSPLIVVANQKSGNNDGEMVLSTFRRVLNPAQVIDLSERPPEVALKWCALLHDIKSTVLVAGGDGTVGWVLDTIDKMKLKPSPAVAIIPLGTGNDLSRVLGWGNEHDADLDPMEVLEQIRKAREVQLDRWSIKVHHSRHLGIRKPAKNMFMYNYISIGVDAQVTLDFHRARDSQFYIFSHRIINKLLYLRYGTQQVMERGCKDLDQRLELYIDGTLIELPSIESIVVLNIPSWGAGVQLWNMGAEEGEVAEQNFSDGKLEVMALYSSFHIAQLQVGLSQPHRLGQASEVRVKLKANVAVQVDGEPWEQTPGEIVITHHNQATVLKLE